MAKTLLFDESFRAKELRKGFTKKSRKGLYWTHTNLKDGNVIETITKYLGQTKAFQEDLLEEQRPNRIPFKEYSVIVLSFPTTKSVHSDEDFLQVSFIVSTQWIVSISSESSPEIERLISEFLENKKKISGVTSIFSSILDVLIEASIDVAESLEDELNKMERSVFRKQQKPKEIFSKLLDLKENLFLSNKFLAADIETIKELLQGKDQFINVKYFSEHAEDRLLYLKDVIDTERENLTNLTSTYLAVLSHDLNEHIYKLTILGAVLLIPTLIASFFGMNVDLPGLQFMEILVLSAAFSALAILGMKKKKWL